MWEDQVGLYFTLSWAQENLLIHVLEWNSVGGLLAVQNGTIHLPISSFQDDVSSLEAEEICYASSLPSIINWVRDVVSAKR